MNNRIVAGLGLAATTALLFGGKPPTEKRTFIRQAKTKVPRKKKSDAHLSVAEIKKRKRQARGKR